MKKLLPILLSAIVALDALAAPVSTSPLIGSWAVDVSRLPMPKEARPKSVTITFKSAADNALTMSVTIVDGAGAKISSVGTATLDGKAAAVTGSPEADLSSMKMPAPGVLVLALAKGGVPASTRVYAAADDGATMVETAVYFDSNGQPIMRTHHFARIR